MKYSIDPNISKNINQTYIPMQCLFISKAKLIDPIDRDNKTNPTYKDRVNMERSGWVSNINPTIMVKSPNAKDQPQFSMDLRLLIEKITSKIPLTKKAILIRIASVSKELKGVLNTIILVKINRIPTISGIYQCLMAFFKEDKK